MTRLLRFSAIPASLLATHPELEGAAAPRRKRPPEISRSEILVTQLQRAGHVGWLREHRFHPTRMWRFDAAHPACWLAIEIEGMGGYGALREGAHRSAKGFRQDAEKHGEAFALGWTVLRATVDELNRGTIIRRLEQRLKVRFGV